MRNPAIDVMRLLAILAVVLVHTTTKTLNATGYDLNAYWWPLLLNQISRFAVPMFFLKVTATNRRLNHNRWH